MDEIKYTIRGNISWKLLNNLVVVVNTDTGEYFTLNYTASVVWQELSKQKKLNQIVDTLHQEFSEVDINSLRTDIGEQVQMWKNENLID